MRFYWMIRHRVTGEEQLVQSETSYPPYDEDIFETAELPRPLDLERESWDWEAGAITTRISLEEAAAADRLRVALEYREQRRNAPLLVWGVFADRAVVVKMDVESRLTIAGAVQMAGLMKAGGLPFTFTFDDEAGQETTIDADQTIALGLGVAVFSGRCDNALRSVRRSIAEALANHASAEEIAEIDITGGYPAGPVSPPLPPSEPES